MELQPPKGRGILGVLSPGEKKLEGKSFYLDNVKRRSSTMLVETISLLGGRVESFLHKDVSFFVTESQEDTRGPKNQVTKAGSNRLNEEAHHLSKRRESVLKSNGRPQPSTPRPMCCGSRGKALLEKAIQNNERFQGSSVLANARSWGVKIVLVDDVLLYLQRLTRETSNTKHKRPERNCAKSNATRVVKAAALKSPYLKIEDVSRKYKPLHVQSMAFPTLCYLGRFSPFEPPPPPPPEKPAEQRQNKARDSTKAPSTIQEEPPSPPGFSPSPWQEHKRDQGYCECCHQPYSNQEKHLQSVQHRGFVLDPSNYSVLDQLVDVMQSEFNLSPSQKPPSMLNSLPNSPPFQDTNLPELEPLTDTDMEHAIQALQIQGSVFNIQVPSPFPTSSSPATSPPDVQPPIQSPSTPNTDIQLPESQLPSPRLIPLPDALPLSPCSDTRHLSPCPDHQCQSSDPYSLPPVLSPQVPDHLLNPHSPYSEPPVLSPEILTQDPSLYQHLVAEAMETLSPQIKASDIVSYPAPAVQISNITSPPHAITVNHVGGAVGSSQEVFVAGVSGVMHSKSSLDCTRMAIQRSHSFPSLLTTANPKKRSRSASPESNPSKRSRMTKTNGHSAQKTRQGNEEFDKPKDKIAPMAVVGLLNPNYSTTDCIPMGMEQVNSSSEKQDLGFVNTCIPQSTVQILQAFSALPVEKVDQQLFPQLPKRTIDISGLCGTSAADQPSGPVTLNTRTGYSHLPHHIAHSTQPIQDCHPSLPNSISSICIDSTLVPNMASLSPSSDSDWDSELMSLMGSAPAAFLPHTRGSGRVDQDFLQRPFTCMQDTSYESRLHSVLQPSTPAALLCGEEVDSQAFSRTVVQIVEVQH